ncbi:P-loop containing nucleoside triphosphate hydrolases superfamily protein [Tasmannia lanceolata]|uniref:P-loop containing nucleoside triphosphate hydrolases superfamily protein n=1 Tax=Tasmannia lanceolata TaxID=3420 RepID=UPI004062D242
MEEQISLPVEQNQLHKDQTEETLLEKADILSTEETLMEKGDILSDHDQALKTLSEKGTTILEHDETQENTQSDLEQKIPIYQRINDLSTKVKMLKNDHTTVSEEVKGAIAESLLSTDLSTALQFLGSKYETLKKKYLEESSERKRLYNEVIELKGNIRVFCRCRPLSPEETANGSSSVLEFDPHQETEFQIICSDSSKKQFKFDHVFGPQDTQEAVFAQTSPIVVSVLDGYNVCIFAYGQTGTGKTFTMEGTTENRGVNYRTLEELFRISNERNSTMKYELFVSMLEVYNEKIRDLLAESSQQPVKKLEIKQVSEGTQEVPGLVEAQVYGTDEVWELLKAGGRSRAVGSTNANQLSSRSHCLLRVTVKGENMVNGKRSRSHLWLVDLAGSERVGKTDVEGERLKESQCINKSLSALGDVISALASKNPHIPYRNSKLTHLLQSSLGGDCKTLMFVQISPSAADLGETLCSLNFASRVRGIEHGPARKQSDPIEFFKYKQMTEKLRQDEKESKKMQESLQSLQLKFAAREHLCRTLQEKVRDLDSQLAAERKARLLQENRAYAKDQKGPIEQKPPLFPSKLRPPLRRINNTIFQHPIGSHRTSIVSTEQTGKENLTMMATTNTAISPSSKPPMKARRISMVPFIRPSAIPPKRRASVAIVQPQSNTLQNSLRSTVPRQSFARDPRRRSRIFSPLPEAIIASTTTPDSKRNSTISNSASKFFSPLMQASWKPKLPTVNSPRQRRFISSPLNLRGLKNAQTLNRFCSSVQKKVGVSPTPQRHSGLSDAFVSQFRQGKEISAKIGSAQRILCHTKRRASIQSFM